ncbi:autophagy-related protein 16-like isoform X3 [Sphaerodactylus townsendi]|uniref:autophagy-related protein 16-like isoform X3 n=1 Tax=Sphaerodactylus townsendi TaxID=933632 RepID=UPI0020270FDD|nr:autophagy-related protein 16-like isoform X3 [Sphaerodactylus townsendi]
MARAAWRQHVREALEERDGRTRCLCGLLEQHEKLQLRLEMLLGGAGVGVRYQLEVVELRRERAELHQQLAVVTEALEKTEAEARGQRDRIRHLFRDLGALKHQHQRLLCQAWGFSQEAEGLRGELDLAWRLLREAQQELLVLEDRWVREKAQEAARLNRANEREEKLQMSGWGRLPPQALLPLSDGPGVSPAAQVPVRESLPESSPEPGGGRVLAGPGEEG